MKTKLFTLIILFTMAVPSIISAQKTFHDFKVEAIDGTEFDLSTLKGKKVLVINTASKCGNTSQYEGLEKLYKQYGSKEFVIVGFPANNFGKQEPGSDEEIAEFCEKNYGVTFPMMSKISVKGDDIHEVYQWLTQKEKNGLLDSDVTWNFQKYMIDENGKLVDTATPKTQPYDEKIVAWIEGK
ncbi:MAG: glutathione peroxidase [Mariniphaga sp.]|nr:glutathione peroxidase [Mariniphaga sp.]